MGDIDIIVYRATKLERFLSKFLPYHLPFISKRKRVKIRWYFRYAYRRRLMVDLTERLKENYASPTVTVKDLQQPITEEDYSWEVHCTQTSTF